MPAPVKLSASRGAPILGISGFIGQFTIWQIIMEELHPGFNASRGYEMPEEKDSAALRWGLAFEDAVTGLAEAKDGRRIRSRQSFQTIDLNGESCANGEITCHLDGVFSSQQSEHDLPDLDEINHEAKTTNIYSFREKWGDPGSDRIPADVQVQVQHQMMISGADKTRISLLVFPNRVEDWEDAGIKLMQTESGAWFLGKDHQNGTATGFWASALAEMGYFHQYEVESNPQTQAIMREKYAEFWQKNIIGQIAPEPQDYEEVRRMFREPKGILVATEECARWIAEFVNIGHEIGASGNLAKRREQLKLLAVDWCRKRDPTIDEDADKKLYIQDSTGKTLATYDGKTFRGRDSGE